MNGHRAALIFGAGSGLGRALAQRFAREGLTACLVRRDATALHALVNALRKDGCPAQGFAGDCGDQGQVAAVIASVERDAGTLEIAIFNVPAMIRGEVLDLSAADFRRGLDLAQAGFIVGSQVAQRMVEQGRGTLIFIGATSALRGSARFAATAAGRHGLRALAQSMARELGPRGVHVAHVILDGGLDTPALRERFPGAADKGGPDSLLAPVEVADTCWQIHRQQRSAWTQEIVLRPWVEKW